RLQIVEPFVPEFNLHVAGLLLFNRQAPASIPILEAIPLNPATNAFQRNYMLAYAYAEAGRFKEAADFILAMPQMNGVSRRSIEDAASLLRRAPTKIDSAQSLPALGSP